MAERGVVAVAGGAAPLGVGGKRARARASEEIVVVHDAARPLVTPELIDAVVERARRGSRTPPA